MCDMVMKKTQFANFPCAMYATDVTLIKMNRPMGTHDEAKIQFSGKHKCYDRKFEVSVLPDGLCHHWHGLYDGSIHDLEIFHAMLDDHSRMLRKTNTDPCKDPDTNDPF